MNKSMRRGSFLIVALAFGALAPADPAADDPVKTLARDELKLIAQVENTMHQLLRRGEMTASDPKHARWAHRKIEALRASGAGKAEMVDALQAHLDAAKSQLEFAKRAHAAAVSTQMDVNEVEYNVLQAEVWLSQEKAR